MFATVTSGGADVPGGKCPVTGQTSDDVLRLISRSMSSVIDDKPVRHKCTLSAAVATDTTESWNKNKQNGKNVKKNFNKLLQSS